MKQPFLVNIGLLLLLLVGTALFDSVLELGQLHGVVFRIYTFYGSIGLFLLNSIIAGVLVWRQQRQRAAGIFLSGGIVAVIGIAIAYVAPFPLS